MALCGGFGIPLYGFGVILFDSAFTPIILFTLVIHCLGAHLTAIARLGCGGNGRIVLNITNGCILFPLYSQFNFVPLCLRAGIVEF